METKELMMRYGLVAGTRFRRSQKLAFLLGITRDFENLGYRTEAKETEDGKHPNVNLYIGELKRANMVVETYYDTPPGSFGLLSYRYFNLKNRKRAAGLSVALPMSILLVAGAVYFAAQREPWFLPTGGIRAAGLLHMLVMLLLLRSLYVFRQGYGARNSLVRNTSSVIALYRFAERKKHEGTALVLTDNGCRANTGARILKEQCRAGQRVVHLDSVGAPGTLYLVFGGEGRSGWEREQLLKLCEKTGATLLDMEQHPELDRDFFDAGELWLLAGELEESGLLLERKVVRSGEISEENLEKTLVILEELEKLSK